MTAGRLSGSLVAALGLVLLAVVVPAETEAVAGGWVRPQTLPNTLATALILLGLLQALTNGADTQLPDAGPVLRASGYLAFTAAAVYAMGRLGFPWVGPVMALVLMLLAGERRILWLALGTLAVPALVWGVVVGLLERSLPGG